MLHAFGYLLGISKLEVIFKQHFFDDGTKPLLLYVSKTQRGKVVVISFHDQQIFTQKLNM